MCLPLAWKASVAPAVVVRGGSGTNTSNAMPARIAAELGEQVIDDATDPAAAVAVGKRQQLCVQRNPQGLGAESIEHRRRSSLTTGGTVLKCRTAFQPGARAAATWPRLSPGPAVPGPGLSSCWAARASRAALCSLLCCLAAILAAAGALLGCGRYGYRRLIVRADRGGAAHRLARPHVVLPYAAIQGIYTGQRLAGHATAKRAPLARHQRRPARVRGLGPPALLRDLNRPVAADAHHARARRRDRLGQDPTAIRAVRTK